MPLTLSFAGISVTLTKLIGDEQPRTAIQAPTVEFSALGTPAIQGVVMETKFLWTISAALTASDRDLLEAIVWEFDNARRNLNDYNVIIDDSTSRLIERSPRSRALVPTTTERSINGGTHTSYFPRCKGVFTQFPKFPLPRSCVKYQSVVFALTETVRVTP